MLSFGWKDGDGDMLVGTSNRYLLARIKVMWKKVSTMCKFIHVHVIKYPQPICPARARLSRYLTLFTSPAIHLPFAIGCPQKKKGHEIVSIEDTVHLRHVGES